jgi:hypothetical protein
MALVAADCPTTFCDNNVTRSKDRAFVAEGGGSSGELFIWIDLNKSGAAKLLGRKQFDREVSEAAIVFS